MFARRRAVALLWTRSRVDFSVRRSSHFRPDLCQKTSADAFPRNMLPGCQFGHKGTNHDLLTSDLRQ